MLIASKYAQNHREVWVFVGPIYQRPAPKLANRVSVPAGFYHIIFNLTVDGVRVLPFIFPQELPPGAKLEDYLTTLRRIEDLTQLTFCPELSPQVKETLLDYKPQRLW
jgi:endonuclease G